MTFRTAGRFRLTSRTITVAVAAVIVVLLAFMGTTASLTSAVTVSKVWSAAGIVTIILVTAAVGLFVAGHQPRNPIGWLLAGETVFMLLSVASGTYAELVYRLVSVWIRPE